MAKEDDDKAGADNKSGGAAKTAETSESTSANQGSAQGTAASATDQKKAGANGADAAGGSSGQTSAGQASPGQTSSGQDAIALLKADHRAVEKLFTEFESASGRRKADIVEQACEALIIHTILEEEIFYPACREAASDEEPLDEAQVEHDSAKLLIVELLDGDEDDEYRDAKFTVLAEQIKHHVAEEEKPSSGIFAKAQAAKIDLADLGRRIQARKQQLEARKGALRPTRPVSLQNLSASGFARGGSQGMRSTGGYRSTEGERDMPRSQDRDRDEYGRFTSDDDRGGRSSSSSSRSGGRGHGGWYGDSEGHSQAARSRGESRSYRDYDDDDDRGYRSRGRDDDDDRGYRSSNGSRGNSGDRGQGGWFGDSRGHSEAARKGWDDPDHRPSGWFGDSRGHSEASRRGWDNPDHGRSGWYGDSEGHSEAARRGWDERGGGRSSRSSRDDDDDRSYRSRSSNDRDRDERGRFTDDDDRGYRSRSRDDDDDDRRYRSSSSSRSSGDRGQGGWFGDSRGHAEAARKGWEDRR